MRKRNKVTFEEFMRKSGIKDRMAAGFWYRIFILSGTDLDTWLGSK